MKAKTETALFALWILVSLGAGITMTARWWSPEHNRGALDWTMTVMMALLLAFVVGLSIGLIIYFVCYICERATIRKGSLTGSSVIHIVKV
ncbi:MAG: hypothetical protein AAB484_01275 [Patescibacteria group bacterium]